MIDLFLEDTLDNLMQIRDAFFEKYTWIYKDSRGIPRDTHFPENLMQSKTADYANANILWKIQRAFLMPVSGLQQQKQQQQQSLQELSMMESRSQKKRSSSSSRTAASNPVATTIISQTTNNSKRNGTVQQVVGKK